MGRVQLTQHGMRYPFGIAFLEEIDKAFMSSYKLNYNVHGGEVMGVGCIGWLVLNHTVTRYKGFIWKL